MMPTSNPQDPGATLIEFALVLPFLLLLALGAFEYGMLFRDSISVSTSAREAGRVAASSANYGDADCVIIEAAAGALKSVDRGDMDEIQIYRSDPSGSVPAETSSTMRRYRPALPSEPSINCGGANWFVIHQGSAWDPDDRVNDPQNADWIGVRVEYIHSWTTGFLWFNGTVALGSETVFRVEPPAPA